MEERPTNSVIRRQRFYASLSDKPQPNYWLTKAKLVLNDERTEQLDLFNSFNLETRYPDYKLSFYQRCTPELVAAEFAQIEEAYSWIRSQFPPHISADVRRLIQALDAENIKVERAFLFGSQVSGRATEWSVPRTPSSSGW